MVLSDLGFGCLQCGKRLDYEIISFAYNFFLSIDSPKKQTVYIFFLWKKAGYLKILQRSPLGFHQYINNIIPTPYCTKYIKINYEILYEYCFFFCNNTFYFRIPFSFSNKSAVYVYINYYTYLCIYITAGLFFNIKKEIKSKSKPGLLWVLSLQERRHMGARARCDAA